MNSPQFSGIAPAMGMLPELAHHVAALPIETIPRQSSDGPLELQLRTSIARALLRPEARPTLEALSLKGTAEERLDLACWLTRLQVAWYAGDQQSGIDASRNASEWVGPLTPVAQVLIYHLFAGLTLGHCSSATAISALEAHCLVLRGLSRKCPASAGAIDELVGALRDQRKGKTLVALQGLERAFNTAIRFGQHWVAALAADEAALVSADAGLDSTVAHYRQLALERYARWGAPGCADALKRQGTVVEQITAVEQCTQEERPLVGSQAELGLSIAHEINQPLAAISLHSSAARKWLHRSQPNVKRALASLDFISEAGRHAGQVVRSIQRLASHQESEVDFAVVDQMINSAVRSVKPLLREHAVRLELALTLRDVVIQANRVQFHQVITNLLVNAIEALSGAQASPCLRCIRVASHMSTGQEIEIIVEDSGPGIEASNRERVFDSRFTTKPGNTGLGLSISRAIVRAHHGRLEFEPREPNGARFRVRLPIISP